MTCQCGNTFTEVYHKDWPTLCAECTRIELREHNIAWQEWFRTLSLQQKREYMNNGPYTLQHVKEMMFKTKDEAI